MDNLIQLIHGHSHTVFGAFKALYGGGDGGGGGGSGGGRTTRRRAAGFAASTVRSEHPASATR